MVSKMTLERERKREKRDCAKEREREREREDRLCEREGEREKLREHGMEIARDTKVLRKSKLYIDIDRYFRKKYQ